MSAAANSVMARRTAGVGSDWIARTADGTERRGALMQICGEGEQVTVLAPGPDVRVLGIGLPGVKAAQAPAAIPFALEDRLAEELEALSLAVGRTGPGGVYPVALVARRRLAGWLDQVTQAGATAEAVVPEPMCLPWTPGELSVLVDGDMAHLRYGAQLAVSVEAGLLPVVLSGLPEPATISAVRLCMVEGATLRPDWMESLAAIAPVTAVSVPSVLAWLAPAAGPARALDFLRAHRRGQSGAGSLLRAWWVPATAAIAGVLVAVAVLLAEQAGLERQLAAWDQRTRDLYVEAFPDARQVDDVQRLLQQRLAAGAASPAGEGRGQFLDLLGSAAPSLGASERLLLTAVSYRSGRLELDLSAPELADFETLRRALAERDGDLVAEVANAVATPEGATARVRLRVP